MKCPLPVAILITTVVISVYAGPNKKKSLTITPRKRSDYTDVHIGIISSWKDFSNRQKIRNSWLSFKGNYSYSFIVGKPVNENESTLKLEDEIHYYNDIIIGDVLENYYNLTRKVIIMLSSLHNKTHEC